MHDWEHRVLIYSHDHDTIRAECTNGRECFRVDFPDATDFGRMFPSIVSHVTYHERLRPVSNWSDSAAGAAGAARQKPPPTRDDIMFHRLATLLASRADELMDESDDKTPRQLQEDGRFPSTLEILATELSLLANRIDPRHELGRAKNSKSATPTPTSTASTLEAEPREEHH